MDFKNIIFIIIITIIIILVLVLVVSVGTVEGRSKLMEVIGKMETWSQDFYGEYWDLIYSELAEIWGYFLWFLQLNFIFFVIGSLWKLYTVFTKKK